MGVRMRQIAVNARLASCWGPHTWVAVKENGFTTYSVCKKCQARKVEQPDGGYQPIDIDWMNGYTEEPI